MPSDSNIYDGPVKSVQSSSAIPLKIITRKNRVQSIHPLYRPQWKKYKKKRKKILNSAKIESTRQKINLLKISQIK